MNSIMDECMNIVCIPNYLRNLSDFFFISNNLFYLRLIARFAYRLKEKPDQCKIW